MRRDVYSAALIRALIVLVFSIVIGGFISALCSCRTCRPVAEQSATASKDSVIERTLYVESLRIDTVTVSIEIPAQSAERVSLDTVSHLETDLAVSDAWLTPDGLLGHRLRNKQGSLESRVPVVAKDTYVGSNRHSDSVITRTETVTVAVTKPLTWWQKLQIWTGALFSVAVIIAAGWRLRRKLE